MNKLKVAVAQAKSVAGDIPANVQQSVSLIERAAELGAKVVLLPEKFLSGYEPTLIKADPARYAISANDERLKPITTPPFTLSPHDNIMSVFDLLYLFCPGDDRVNPNQAGVRK
ncbi:nitrilase/cyanide hydratase and apolipoprotein N-acyltransferase [Erwinia piriflorinigrans CFBP 5888]|uniref:Nitrilase/cyanide hydratase and apolipoprotein N-acyltransferase n=1 Tax=Erwinia piriflorinigrans CFBP 5888 TaxID=1161919 RepID=V5ZCI5_9GAMM|nr:nitrilase/cyanide hydratase and apolipoprotein N-acyltransferase [Erwinia piriflorinigrans CFBP 5888]